MQCCYIAIMMLQASMLYECCINNLFESNYYKRRSHYSHVFFERISIEHVLNHKIVKNHIYYHDDMLC